MVRTILTPQNTDIHLSIPKNYIGRKIEVMYYPVDELMEESELSVEDEKKGWQDFSNQNFLKGYGESEPEYTIADVKEPNPEYKHGKENNSNDLPTR